jgi:NAD(P)-dependent dehydrogenase (short-subunit alcohol dehydrogenase family)/acyl carrier protein
MAAPDLFTIRATERADYDALIKELHRRGELSARILHLWSLDSPSPGLTATAAFDEAQARSYFSLILLTQALAKHGGSTPVQVGVVTDQLQAVLGDEALRSTEATVSGACKVISQEYPHLRCRWIDVVPSDSRVPKALLDEISREPFEPIVAYRNGRRWVQGYDPIALAHADQRPALLEDGGVYLITGGVGNIGLILAEAIARDVKAKLVLTGRSPFPERSRWSDYLASQGNDATSARIRKVQALEKLGAEVMIVSADAADAQHMQAVLDAAEQKWGRISGVIYGAANTSPNAFGPINEIDWASMHANFGPKDHGLLVLQQLLHDRQPKFWALLSSLSAVLGGLGLASYASSNAFLDAEAQRMNAAGDASWITINWDAWDFTPGAVNRDAITAADGGEAFRRILSGDIRQVVVSTKPLAARLSQWVRLERMEKKPAAPARSGAMAGAASGNGAARPAGSGNGTPTTHARPELSTQFAAPGTDMEKTIAGVWQQFLGVEPIGINDKFFELGGHSLLAIQLLARLREIFGLDIPVHRIFEAPTVAEFAKSIERDQKEAPADAKLAAETGDLEQALKLVEGLSDAEVEAILNETEEIHRTRASHV